MVSRAKPAYCIVVYFLKNNVKDNKNVNSDPRPKETYFVKNNVVSYFVKNNFCSVLFLT